MPVKPVSSGAQLRQPRLAELVAAALRDRILNGDLKDGERIPKQEELLAEFGVSKPSMREALRILETEGLVSVRRGNVGGAVVHHPSSESPAYMLALVLEGRDVRMGDVFAALQRFEPICAALCAERTDRRRNVLPILRKLQKELGAAFDNPAEFVELPFKFHEALVACCGNETIITLVGMLESIYTQHGVQHNRALDAATVYPASYRQAAFDAHQRIIDLIAEGASDDAAQAARDHLLAAGDSAWPQNQLFNQRPVLAELARVMPMRAGRPTVARTSRAGRS